MRLGFRAGDFVNAIALSKKVRASLVDVPGQFLDLRADVANHYEALERVEVAAYSQPLTDAQLADLKSVARSCHSVLGDLYKALEKQGEDPGHREIWSPDDIKELCSRFISSTSLLNAFRTRLVGDSTTKLPRHDDDMSFQGALKWLSSLDYVSQQSEIFAKRQPGTGQWLLDSLEFRRWMDTPGSTLFCPGVPGAGKTVLTSVVVNHLSSTFIEGPKVGIAYAYVDSLRDSGQALDQALCSLISQLALIHSEGGQAVKALRNGHTGKRTRPSTDETMGLLDTVTKSQSPSRVFVLIDAMDECQISGECWAGFLTRLFRLQGAHVNLFVTSSFTAEIMTAFDGRASIVEIRATDHDLRTYVDGQIDSLPACVKDNIKLQEDIKTTITSASHGMFLLAHVYMSSLEDKLTPESIRDTLGFFQEQNEPPGTKKDEFKILSRAYDQAMGRICQKSDTRDLAEKALAWVTCAARPLQTFELQIALTMNEDDWELYEKNIVQVEDIVSACAGLVVVDKTSDIVHLSHSTMHEYFTRTLDHWFTQPHLSISKACVALLSSDWSGALVGYASKFWSYHLRRAPNAQREDWVLDFLGSNLVTRTLTASDLFYLSSKATALHLAAYFGLDVAVDIFIQRSHDPNVPGGQGRTPLFCAAKGEHCSTMKLLVKYGAKVDARCHDDYNRYALDEVVHSGIYDVVELLLELEAKCDPGIDTWREYRDAKHIALGRSVMCGDVRMATLLLDAGASTEYRGLTGTALMTATTYGIMDVTPLLIKHGADINLRDQRGETALMKALSSTHRNVEQVKFLLESKADIEMCDNVGQTALARMARDGNEEMVRLLIEHGAKVDGSSLGPKPLYLAVHDNHTETVKLLLEAGADPDAKTNWPSMSSWLPEGEQISAFTLAKRMGRSDILPLLQAHRKHLGWQDWLSSYF